MGGWDLREPAGRGAALFVGGDSRGHKQFLAIEEGLRESAESWRAVLLDLRDRGLAVDPELGVGDGGLGFWVALAEVFPQTRTQRCWVHKTVNVLDKLPISLQGQAKSGLHDISGGQSCERGEGAGPVHCRL